MQKNSLLNSWLLACRPKTLPAAIAPVILGSAMALGDGGLHIPSAILAFLGAMVIQIGTNLANDYFDFVKGADTHERIGPTRVTQAGLIKPKHIQLGFTIAFGIAAIIAVELSLRGGWPIILIGILSIISGILYTAGPRPLGYLGLGEIFVFIFFGPVAVAATYYIQALECNWGIVLSGFAPGFLSAAILVVNNLRDIHTDRKSGKKTLAARFGMEFAQSQYLFLIALAALMPSIIYVYTQDHPATLLSGSIIFFAIPMIRNVFTKSDGPSLNRTLADTGMLLLLYSLLFSFGWVYADLRF